MIQHKSIKPTFFITVLVLMVANIILFSKTMEMTDRLLQLESSIGKLKYENQLLQKKYYSTASLTGLEKLASDLGFEKHAETVYLEQLDYAYGVHP